MEKTPAKDENEEMRNGYEALRKWDGRREDGSYLEKVRDGFITPEDPVFDRLRLWLDVNHDAVAQPEELSTLAERQVVAIDLDYARDFVETDEFGNSTRMKSVAKTADGKLHLMYDLWFRALDPSLVPGQMVASHSAQPSKSAPASTAKVARALASVATPASTVEAKPAPAERTSYALVALGLLIMALTLIFIP